MFWYYACLAVDAIDFVDMERTALEYETYVTMCAFKLIDIFGLGDANSKLEWQRAGYPDSTFPA
jgi:hypothetical protein